MAEDAPNMSEHGSKPVLGTLCLNILHLLKTELFSWNYDAYNMAHGFFGAPKLAKHRKYDHTNLVFGTFQVSFTRLVGGRASQV
jgi:hypothetical protein